MRLADVPTDWDDRFMEAMQVDLPTADFEGMRVTKFEVKDDLENWTYALEGRASTPGMYTRIQEKVPNPNYKTGSREAKHKWKIWMTDTEAERRDHLPPLRMAEFLNAERMLINGLGLGMVVKAALILPSIKHIDVVEIDERVIRLVGPSYDPDRVSIHHIDAVAMSKRWPPGTRWDVAWHDIWPGGHPIFKTEMVRLMRSYARRAKWQGAWAHDAILGDASNVLPFEATIFNPTASGESKKR